MPISKAARPPESRGASSVEVTVDVGGAFLGAKCTLVRRVANSYLSVSREEAAAIQALVVSGIDDPDWLFGQCRRIAGALADANVALAQIYAIRIPIRRLTSEQLSHLAYTAAVVKAGYNPDEPRDAQGRWTDEDDGTDQKPSDAPPAKPSVNSRPIQVAADNRRQNKMVADIVVQLGLTKDQRQELHRTISGQGYTYQEILDIAKEMFNK